MTLVLLTQFSAIWATGQNVQLKLAHAAQKHVSKKQYTQFDLLFKVDL